MPLGLIVIIFGIISAAAFAETDSEKAFRQIQAPIRHTFDRRGKARKSPATLERICQQFANIAGANGRNLSVYQPCFKRLFQATNDNPRTNRLSIKAKDDPFRVGQPATTGCQGLFQKRPIRDGPDSHEIN